MTDTPNRDDCSATSRESTDAREHQAPEPRTGQRPPAPQLERIATAQLPEPAPPRGVAGTNGINGTDGLNGTNGLNGETAAFYNTAPGAVTFPTSVGSFKTMTSETLPAGAYGITGSVAS